MKKLDLNRILKLFLPSLFFIVAFICYVSGPIYLIRYIVAGVFCLPLVINLFFQNRIFSRIIGSVLLLLSLYMMLAIFSDVVNGKAILGYLVTYFFFLVCIAMSVLLIIGYERKNVGVMK